MARYTIDIPDELYREIQERRHLIDVGDVCHRALDAAVARTQQALPERVQLGGDIADDLTRMFNGAPRSAE